MVPGRHMVPGHQLLYLGPIELLVSSDYFVPSAYYKSITYNLEPIDYMVLSNQHY